MTAETLLTIKYIEIIEKEKFSSIVLDIDNKTFMIYIATLVEQTIILIYLLYQAHVILLTSIEIFIQYSNFSDIFFSYFTAKLLEYNKINNYPINLLNDKQLLYSLIYSPKLVELKILKTYIKFNLASSFIKPSKSSIGTLILFI